LLTCEISACFTKLVLTTENKAETIVRFEFESKETSKRNSSIFYTIRDTINQVCLYEDHQLAKNGKKSLKIVFLNSNSCSKEGL
jgi:hypothetical protein